MRKIALIALSLIVMVASEGFASINHVSSKVTFNKIFTVGLTGETIDGMGQKCQTKYSGLLGGSMIIEACVDTKRLMEVASASVSHVGNVSFSAQGRYGQYAFIHPGTLALQTQSSSVNVLRALINVSKDFQKATGALMLPGGTITILGRSRQYHCVLFGSASASHQVLKYKSDSKICSRLK